MKATTHQTDPPAKAVGNVNLITFLDNGIGQLNRDLGGHLTA
jgi:hypothetical protein